MCIVMRYHLFIFLEASANHILVWPLLPLKTIHELLLKIFYRYYLQSRDSNYQIFLKSQFTFMIIFLRIHFIATTRKNIYFKSFTWIDIIFTLIYTCMWIKKGWKKILRVNIALNSFEWAQMSTFWVSQSSRAINFSFFVMNSSEYDWFIIRPKP